MNPLLTTSQTNKMNPYQHPKAVQDSLILPQQPKRHRNLWNLPDKDPSVNRVRVVNINFQSVLHKKAELLDLIFTHKPHIIIGTETWLSNNIHDNEVIPEYCNYVIYRNDRSDGYGGILIAISKQFTSSKIAMLQTNCEILWTQIIMNKGANLCRSLL